MANELKLGLVIGGAVSGTVKSAFKDIDGRIKSLDKAGAQSRAMQRNIGDTIKLREEWRKDGPPRRDAPPPPAASKPS